MTLNTITGIVFKNEYPNLLSQLFKLTNYTERHNGIIYCDGLNIAPDGFKIHFCTKDQMHKWIKYNGMLMWFYRQVEIPDDALIHVLENGFIANKIILGSKHEIWNDSALCTELVKKNGAILEYVESKAQTAEMCMAAVKENSFALEHVRDDLQTPEMCTEIVSLHPFAIQHVRYDLQTIEMCLEAYLKCDLVLPHLRLDIQIMINNL